MKEPAAHLIAHSIRGSSDAILFRAEHDTSHSLTELFLVYRSVELRIEELYVEESETWQDIPDDQKRPPAICLDFESFSMPRTIAYSEDDVEKYRARVLAVCECWCQAEEMISKIASIHEYFDHKQQEIKIRKKEYQGCPFRRQHAEVENKIKREKSKLDVVSDQILLTPPTTHSEAFQKSRMLLDMLARGEVRELEDFARMLEECNLITGLHSMAVMNEHINAYEQLRECSP